MAKPFSPPCQETRSLSSNSLASVDHYTPKMLSIWGSRYEAKGLQQMLQKDNFLCIA